MSQTDNNANNESHAVDYLHWGNVSRAVLNGVIGDYLVEQNNPLAIDMGFYHGGQPLTLPHSDIPLTNKVVVLLHGLTNLESIWDLKENEPENTAKPLSSVNYGTYLQRDFGYTPLFLRYNTGLPIEENGKQFAQLMDALMAVYPQPIDEIILVGFSMGGLLMRYAQKNAMTNQADWLSKVTQCFYLGTPHEGSYFERFGHLASSVVRSIPKTYINHWADWIDVRSSGIQDLKHGLVHLSHNDVAQEESQGVCGSFYPQAQHYFVSGSLSQDTDSVFNKLFGDALVSKNSAYPPSAPQDSQSSHFDGIPHIPLAHSDKVYQQIKQWIEESNSSVDLTVHEPTDAQQHSQAKTMLLSQLLSASHRDVTSETANYSSLANPLLVAGAFDLMAVGYEKTVEAVEKVHLSIAKEPHVVLNKIPVVNAVSSIVERSQVGITEGVYGSVRLGGMVFRTAAKLLKM